MGFLQNAQGLTRKGEQAGSGVTGQWVGGGEARQEWVGRVGVDKERWARLRVRVGHDSTILEKLSVLLWADS